MRIRLKLAACVSALASLALCTAACSSGSPSGTTNASKPTITIWYGAGSISTAALTGVQKEFPQATIQLLKIADVETKLTSALRANSGIPSIAVGIGNLTQLEPAASMFVDLDQYGFKSVASNYLAWPVNEMQYKGEQLGIPIDVEPQAFFYRADAFKAAGLPTSPTAVAKLVSTWSNYMATAKTVQAKTGHVICDQSYTSIYLPMIYGAGYDYYTANGVYDPSAAVNETAFLDSYAWGQDKLCMSDPSQYITTSGWNSAIVQGDLVGFIGPMYATQYLTAVGTSSAGQWRITTPPVDSSQPGSAISVFKASPDVSLSVQIAEWMTNAANGAQGYEYDALFPTTPGSYTMAAMNQPSAFFGGEVTGPVLGEIADKSVSLYVGPNSTTAQSGFSTAQVYGIAGGTSPAGAWADGLKRAPQA